MTGNNLTYINFFKFLLVGLLNTFVGYMIYMICILLGLNFRIAILVATVLGVMFNFKTYGTIVFKSNNNLLFIKFGIAYFLMYIINLYGVEFLNNLGFTFLIAGLLMAGPIALLSYFINSRYIFK